MSINNFLEGKVSDRDLAYKRLVRKLTVENIWMYVLRMLLERPLYAYEIRNILKSRFGFNVATITTYMVLYKMEREGLIKKTTKRESGRRQYYKITPLGLKTLKDGLSLLEKTLKNLTLPESSISINNPLNDRDKR